MLKLTNDMGDIFYLLDWRYLKEGPVSGKEVHCRSLRVGKHSRPHCQLLLKTLIMQVCVRLLFVRQATKSKIKFLAAKS